MRRYTVKGPAKECEEIMAAGIDDALAEVRSKHPGKHVAADASEVIYVCNSVEDLEACQARLR